jgi:hypothetical protein
MNAVFFQFLRGMGWFEIRVILAKESDNAFSFFVRYSTAAWLAAVAVNHSLRAPGFDRCFKVVDLPLGKRKELSGFLGGNLSPYRSFDDVVFV